MKIRDSGMPEEIFWESLFDVPLILTSLGIERFHDVAELGCGYGTFSIPIAKTISGALHAFDIDPVMVERTLARGTGLNIIANVRDVMELGFGVQTDAVLLFNILHCEQPVELLQHARRALRARGEVLVIHWRFESSTPRGPCLDIRPKSELIIKLAELTCLAVIGETLDLPPWHYGLRFRSV